MTAEELRHTNKKACIFDLDGTLADTVRSIAYSGNLTLGAFGYKPLPEENYKYYAGDGAKELVRRFLGAVRGRDGGDLSAASLERALEIGAGVPDEDREFQDMYRKYREIFGENCMYEVKPYPGIPELLQALRQRGVKTAVLSNKPHAQTLDVVERLFGPGTFDMVQGQMEGIPKKPSPKGALHIAAAFSAEPWECLYAGDTNTDMQTGNAAGMFTVGVLWGFRDEKELLDNHAMALLRHPLEMLPYLGA